MNRERRYHVAKIEDVLEALSEDEKKVWANLHLKVLEHRLSNGKAPIECLVIESDWPEYEVAYSMIEARVDGFNKSFSPAFDTPSNIQEAIATLGALANPTTLTFNHKKAEAIFKLLGGKSE